MKRRVLLLCAAALLIVSLQGAVAAQEPVTITLWHGWTGAWTQTINEIVEMFEASHPHIKVNPLVVPYDERDTKLMAAIAAGDPPDIIFTMTNIVSYAARDAIVPVDKLMPPDQLQEYLDYQYPFYEGNRYKGHIWSFHGFVDAIALYYNKNHFREVGLDPNAPPKDIATLDAYAEKLTKVTSGGQIDRAGFLPDDLYRWADVFGGSWLDGDKITATHPKNIEAAKWMASYSEKYDVRRITAFNAGLATERAQALDPFVSERFAMQNMGQWKILDIDRYAPEGFDYGVVPLPAPPEGRQNSMIIPSGYGLIPKNAKHPEAALEYLLYWVGKGHEADRAKIFTLGGWFPLADAVTEEPVYQEYIRRYPEFQVFSDLLRSSDPTGFATPVELYYLDRINNARDRIRLLQGDPAQVLEQVQKEVQAELDKLEI
ncbi:MAG: ABC transporter substrate-binding protein [Firmicutes bacterium]|nr:ABC transporter substrate-binding protein [Bacillota bacterium]